LGTKNVSGAKGAPGTKGATGARPRPTVSAPVEAGKSIPAGQVVGSGPARNAPCPCGSGKKYKRCHGAPNAV
jgi:preprotein translocase subunit SecA